jgi:hypothetical protein
MYPIYEEFEKIISQSGNVRHVFSGHYHDTDWSKLYNGVEYHIIPALSLDENTPHYKIFQLNQ